MLCLPSFIMIYDGGMNCFFSSVLKVSSLHPAPLQTDLEQKHVLGLLCTNETEYQKNHVGNERCIHTESHLHRLIGSIEYYILDCI